MAVDLVITLSFAFNGQIRMIPMLMITDLKSVNTHTDTAHRDTTFVKNHKPDQIELTLFTFQVLFVPIRS